MPFMEMTQFSRIAYEAWLASEEPTKPAAEDLGPRERGMRMLTGLLGKDSGKNIIDEFGGLLNIKTIRVMFDKDKKDWTLEFALIIPLKDVQRKLQEQAFELARLQAAAKLLEDRAQKEKEREERKKVQEQRTAAKKQREERLKALGKRPFQKKSAKPQARNNYTPTPGQ